MTEPMTERDLHPDDRRLREALRALPAATAGEDFADEVLARLDDRAARSTPPVALARPRLRHLALIAAAAAALAVAVGHDGLWPTGPWLWFGAGTGGSGKAGAAAAGGSESGAAVSPDGQAGAATADGAAPEPEPGAAAGMASDTKAGSPGADRRSAAGGQAGPREPFRKGASGEGSGTAEAASPVAGATEGSRGSAAGNRATGSSGTGRRSGGGSRPVSAHPAAAGLDPAGPSGGSADHRAAVPDVVRGFAAAGGPSGLTEAEAAAARIALLRHERERLLADLRTLRAAVPPEEPAGLLLAGGESVDVVLGLGPGAAGPAVRQPGGSQVRPAGLQRDDRRPRLY